VLLEETAQLMNELFINIKVDREERPDVDDVYMAAVTYMNRGQGGWPMSVFLEPGSLKPFIGGTYFPPEDNFGRPGFKSVLKQVNGWWHQRRPEMLSQADRVSGHVAGEVARQRAPVDVDASNVEGGVALLLSAYDPAEGGFGRERKFPMPSYLDLMMAAAWDDPTTQRAVLHTLDRMAVGGIYDQVGGGFHRYAVDEQWDVPHLEKMLYDTGQLASTYAAAYERTGDAYYGQIVRETLDYILREMTGAGGGFYSAQDAEVNHREGQNYIWDAAEVEAALNDAGLGGDVEFALKVYGLDAGTNFQDPHHPEDPPKNVLRMSDRPDVLAPDMNISLEEFDERRARINAALLAVRDTRDQPGTDDKVLASWNGLMIAGLADGGRALSDARYVEAAADAARFVLSTMRDAETGDLMRSHRAGRTQIRGFLEDYAFMIKGLIAVYRANGDRAMLESARALAAEARTLFHDELGGFFDTREDQEDLFLRLKTSYDGATPSANGVMLNNLLDLHELTDEPGYLDDAVATLESLSSVIVDRPASATTSLRGLHRIAMEHAVRLEPAPVFTRTWDTSRAEGRVQLIQVRSQTPEVTLAPDGSASFIIDLRTAGGYHVNANRPGRPDLIPLEFKLVGCDGLELAVGYPEGDPFEGPDGTIWVHDGRVLIQMRVTRVGAISDTCTLMVTYQLCTNKLCLAPKTEPIEMTFIGTE
jgi:uncharacterized protein YyaL (SSP411 family)